MKLITLAGLLCCLVPGGTALLAQENPEVEALRRQLKEANENFQRASEQYRQTIEALSRRLEAVAPQKGEPKVAPAVATKPEPPPPNSQPSPQPTAQPQPWSPAQPLSLAKAGASYLNLSFDAVMNVGWSTAREVSEELNLGDHDPTQRGFSLRNAELALDGAVDPYFNGFANIVLKLENDGATEIELEETYLQTSALPGGFQIKAGQFFANFGRQNPQHPHQWAFVDQPLVLGRTFGPDGLRNVGAQGSWLVPVPFYTEAFLGVFNGQGGTAFSFRNPGDNDAAGVSRYHGRATAGRGLRGPADLLFVPRLATSFDVSDRQTIVLGASAGLGPNDTGSHRRTEIYGMDAYWKWKPANAREGYPFVSWQGEGLYRRFEAGPDSAAGLRAEVLRDHGFYSQVLWGFQPRWVLGLRGEFVTGNTGAFDDSDVFRSDRTRVSPNLTWLPSEFSKVRLQYNHDRGDHFGEENSIWLQLEFLLGAHGAHKF